jgi:copper(I)-binding protein
MRKLLFLVTFALLPAARGLAGDVKVETPWVFAVPPGAKDTAAFMSLINTSDKPVRLTGGKTEVADRVSPMITTKTEGRMGMKDVDYIEIPAGGRVTLAPGADHLMIYGLKKPLTPGQNVPIEVTLSPGGKMTINAVVARREPK